MQGIAQKILANPAKYSIEQLTQGVQNGVIPAYVGIPLIQEKIQQQKEAQSMSMGQQQRPVAEQIMQEAQSAGVPALSSNLPQEYAGGGIIAFDEGGEVKRYANAGLTSTGESERKRVEEAMAKLRTYGLRQRQQDPQGYAAAEAAAKEAQEALSNVERGITGGPVGAMGRPMGFAPIPPAVAPAVAPTIETPYDPTTATRRSAYPEQTPPSTPSTAPASPAAPVIPDIKMPTLQTYTPKVATLPERTMGDLVDLDAITKDMPEKTKTAFDTAVNATKTELEGFDKPGFDTREGRLEQREAGLEKDSAIGRALNLMSLGFGIAGSKERTLAGALGNEGRQGIADLIRGEAANRAAKDRLEDARDNFEQQKIAAKKGNYQAAQVAGRDAANDLRAATSLSLQGAQAGNAQAINMFSALSQRDIGAANVTNQGEQLRAAAIAEQNRNALGITGLGLQAQQLAQTGAFQNKQLENQAAQIALQDRRLASLDKASQARIQQVQAKALNDFAMGEGAQLRSQLAKDYGPNFLTATDKRSLEAARIYNQRKQAYLADIRGQAIDALSARQADDLLLSQ